MTTRSIVLWRTRSVGRPAGDVFTCPDGVHAILKSIYGRNQSASSTLVLVQVIGSSGAPAVGIVAETVESAQNFLWEGWVVLEPGDRVNLFTDVGPLDSWGSGALLPVPA